MPSDLSNFIAANANNPQAIARFAQQTGASDTDLANAAGVSVEEIHNYFRQAGFPLGTMLTGTLERAIGTDQGVRQLAKGEDVGTEKAIGMQGNKIVVQQYDAYGQPTRTRLASPNQPDYAGFLQVLNLVAPVFLPGVGSFIGQALGVSAEIGAAIANIGMKVAQGASLNEAILTAGIQYGSPQIFNNPMVAKIAGDLGSAAATGQDLGQAAIKSVIGVAGPEVLDGIRPTGDQVFDSGLASAVASAASAKLTGGDALQSAVSGFVAGTQKAAGKQQQPTEVAGGGPADYIVGERDPALMQVGLFDSTLGLTQSALAELGRSWLAAGQQVGIAPEALQRGIDWLKTVEDQGAERISPAVRQQQDQFIKQIYSVASNPNSTAADIAQAIIKATSDNPLGAFTLVSKEVIQELPQLLIPGRIPAMLGNFALNIAESAGSQALQKIDELRKANPNMTNEQLIAAARNDAGIAGAVTAAVSLIPGVNAKVLQPFIEGFNEFLEEGLTTYLTTGDKSKALGSAVLGGVLGAKTTGAMQTGEEVAAAAQQNLPSLGTIEVRSTRLPSDVDTSLSVVPTMVDKTKATGVTPTVTGGANPVVVVSTDPVNNTALVIDSSGKSQIVDAKDAATGGQVTAGQTLNLTQGGQLTTSGATSDQVKVGDLTPTPQEKTVSPTKWDANQPATPEIIRELLTLKGLPVTEGGVRNLMAGNPTIAQAGQEIEMLAMMQPKTQAGVDQTVATQPVGGTPTIIGQQDAGVTAKPATEQVTKPDVPTQPTAAYSANVAATPEIVAQLLALKGLPASDRTIQILLSGNPTVAQVGKEIQSLADMRGGVTPATSPAQQVGGTPTVTTGQQGGPTVITQGGTTGGVTPGVTTTGTTQTLDLTGGLTRPNIDTISLIDTVGGVDTLSLTDTVGGARIDTLPAGIDTIGTQDTVPATSVVDTKPTFEDTTPVTTQDQITDQDVIRFLGLDQVDTTPSATVAEEKKEPLTVVPRTVYTPPGGVRVAEGDVGALPTRVSLSEREGEDVYGTPEEEQEPVWNIRSLKLRRALRI